MSSTPTATERWSARRILSKFSLLIIVVVFMAICALANPNFLTANNLINILKQNSVNIILALGAMILITSGLLDLSSGSVVACAGCMAILFYSNVYPSVILASLVAIGVAVAWNFISGLMVTTFRTPPFIATLATQTMARGFILYICNGQNIYDLGNITVLGQASVWFLPVPAITMMVCFGAIAYLMRQTRTGRSFFAIGGNENAALSAGINVNRKKMTAYLINGVLVGIAGITFVARVNAGVVNGGQSYEFDAMTATIIGGTSFSGGVSSTTGTLLGALLVGFLANIMNLMGINSYLQQLIKGVIIALAVIWDIMSKTRKTYKKGRPLSGGSSAPAEPAPAAQPTTPSSPQTN